MIPSYHPTFSTTPPPPQKKKKREKTVSFPPQQKKNTKQNTPPKKNNAKKKVVSSFPKQKKHPPWYSKFFSATVKRGKWWPRISFNNLAKKEPLLENFSEGFLRQKAIVSTSHYIPYHPMYGIFTYIWLIFMVNVGNYTIHGWYRYLNIYTYIYSIDLDSLLSWFIGILELPHY